MVIRSSLSINSLIDDKYNFMFFQEQDFFTSAYNYEYNGSLLHIVFITEHAYIVIILIEKLTGV